MAAWLDPTTLRYLWTQSYERDVSDVLKAQDEVVQKITTDMDAALTALVNTGE